MRFTKLICWHLFLLANAVANAANYSPYNDRSFPKNVYWGDTHLHTNLSLDAYNFGNRTVGPDEAYRFAKGEPVKDAKGIVTKISKPLDFLVVADHATNMGVMTGLERRDVKLLDSDIGRQFLPRLQRINTTEKTDPTRAKELSMELHYSGFLEGSEAEPEFRQSVWRDSIAIAEQHNDPGKFTALLGYEWTQSFLFLHRVVIFKDGPDKVGKIIPFSQYDSNNPEDLWAFLASYEQQTGGDVLAIPHSGDATTGTLFAPVNANSKPISVDYAVRRSRWEPLYETTQMLGDSETHPRLSPADAFADYETHQSSPKPIAHNEIFTKYRKPEYYLDWLASNIAGEDSNWRFQYEYARSGLKQGLGHKARLGVNPFKFGLIGGTDTHSGLATADESNFLGKGAYLNPNRVKDSYKGVASGYAAVWAHENTRESLFAAMKRKEVYATTGPRITVRFFGGWNYQASDAFSPDLAVIGYDGGVPMGGDLTAAPQGKTPTFLIRAVKDPDGANLDRVQVIKGWRSEDGELYEKVYDVALSDGRKIRGNKKSKPVRSTVNIKDASYSNTIGDPELAVVWEDPDFDSTELAFYYVRVIEIPTPRWAAYDVKRFNLKDITKGVPMVTQERAYASPIWYSPE